MRVGIIGAMDVEVELIKREMKQMSCERRLGMDFCAGTLGNTDVVVAMCGVGKVNAALCACELVEHYGVDCVINTGVAGSLDARIHVGDLVVSTDAVHHDMNVEALGYARGQVPDMDVFSFHAAPELRAMTLEVASAVALQAHVFEGRIASGDQFVSSLEHKEQIVSDFGAICCEMEGAAIAHTCYLFDVPFVIVRAISDSADGEANVDYPTFKMQAASCSAAIVSQLVARLNA